MNCIFDMDKLRQSKIKHILISFILILFQWKLSNIFYSLQECVYSFLPDVLWRSKDHKLFSFLYSIIIFLFSFLLKIHQIFVSNIYKNLSSHPFLQEQAPIHSGHYILVHYLFSCLHLWKFRKYECFSFQENTIIHIINRFIVNKWKCKKCLYLSLLIIGILWWARGVSKMLSQGSNIANYVVLNNFCGIQFTVSQFHSFLQWKHWNHSTRRGIRKFIE